MENDEKLNDLVPAETRLHYVLVENGKLKAEIEHLEEELIRQEKAISAFKKWQRKVVERKFEFWINSAKEIIGEGIEREECRELIRFFKAYEAYNGTINSLLRDKEKMETNAEKLKTRYGIQDI